MENRETQGTTTNADPALVDRVVMRADERLISLGCKRDPSARGYDRWTHLPSEKSVVRHPYLSWPDDWESKKQDFADAIQAGTVRNWSA